MSRRNQATINFYLRTSKPLSNGTCSIMLRVCFHGFKDKSTGYCCSKKNWDSKNQVVKKGENNFAMINYELGKLKSKIISKRDEFDRLGISYTPAMLLSSDERKRELSNVVSDLIDGYILEKELRSSTVISWNYSKKLIEVFDSGVIINDIDEGWVKRWGRWLKGRGLSDGTIRTRLGAIAAIYRWSSRKGIVDIKDYPFRDWNYCQHYKIAERVEYIDLRAVDIIKEYFLSKVIVVTGDTFEYINEGYIDYKNPLFSLYFWLVGYFLQGLSPLDICLLKKSDFVRKVINGDDYWCIDTSRMKTSKSVKIRVRVNTIYSQVMISRMLMVGGEWFLPILHGLDGSDIDRCKTRVKAIFSYWLNPRLGDWWKLLNDVIINRNVEEGLNIPLIPDNATFYSYRHSFAQMYLQKGGSVLALATLLGRSINSISVYVKQLTEEEDLVEAISVI